MSDQQTSDYNLVKNLVSVSMTPLEAKISISAKLTTNEILELKQYYASLHNLEKPSSVFLKSLLEYGCIFMVGLPASGKTTFCNQLLKYYGENIIHLNQDEIGRNACYEILCKYAKKQNVVILLDRCNLTSTERNEWISTYRSLSSKPILCVSYNLGTDVCKKRLLKRTNHDMQNPNIIENLSKKMEMPSLTEGFSRIVNIMDNDDVETLLKEFGITYISPIDQFGLKKFVRTKHIINLGGAGRDDLMWQGKELTDFLSNNLIIEEKIDGANLGIFLDENSQIIIQNRSHYISPSYHKQFSEIDKWKYQHENDIRSILGNNPWIIYGEWVVAKHSIHYTRLPNKFILFDIYDREQDKFFSRSRVEQLIAGTQFVQIHKITEGNFNLTQLKKIAYSNSVYYDGPVEGIYARAITDDGQFLKYRGKIVRHDFIAGGQEHWMKYDIVKNLFI